MKIIKEIKMCKDLWDCTENVFSSKLQDMSYSGET